MEIDKILLFSENAACYIEALILITYTSVLVYLNSTYYKIHGLTLNLILLQWIGAVCFGLETILESFLDYRRALNEKPKKGLILCSQIFGIIDISSNYILFWMFVIKYWSIALKLESINLKKNQDRLNKLFTAILAISIFLSVVEITLVFYWFPKIFEGKHVHPFV